MLDFDMRPYEIYVWGSYGLSAIGILGLIIHSFLRHRSAKSDLLATEARWIANKPEATKGETKDES
jgi:heme exporter protein CcmD